MEGIQVSHLTGLNPCLYVWMYRSSRRPSRIKCPRCSGWTNLNESVLPVMTVTANVPLSNEEKRWLKDYQVRQFQDTKIARKQQTKTWAATKVLQRREC